MSNLNHHQSFILNCLKSGSLKGKEIIESYDRMWQVMCLLIYSSGTDRGRSFTGRLVHCLREPSQLEEDDLVRLEGEKISLTVKGKRLSSMRARRAKFGISI